MTFRSLVHVVFTVPVLLLGVAGAQMLPGTSSPNPSPAAPAAPVQAVPDTGIVLSPPSNQPPPANNPGAGDPGGGSGNGSASPVNTSAQPPRLANPGAAASPAVALSNPSPARIQQIIQSVAEHEQQLRNLLKHNYTYKESIDVETTDEYGNPRGSYQQVDDIVFSNQGQREIVCTYCPQPTLQDIEVTQEDIDDFFNMDMYTIALHDLSQYNIRYIGHVPLDKLTAYEFSVGPKQIVKGHRYFEGTIWVDDHDLQIVKSSGRAVPNEYDKHGHPQNTFLPFTTYRQRIDGLYWFPVFTSTNSYLDPDKVKMVLHFENYKRYSVSSRIIVGKPVGSTPAPK